MKTRNTPRINNQQFSFRKLTVWIGILFFSSISAFAQKSYIPGAVTNLPGLFIPNSRILIADFDNDGDKDILYQNGNTPSVDIHYLRNNSNSSFTPFNVSGLGHINPAENTHFTGLKSP